MLAVVAAVLGLVLSLWLVDLLKQSPTYIPRLRDARLNPLVLACCAGAGVLSAVLFGLLPAFSLSRRTAVARFGSPGRSFARSLLVAGEVGLTLVLLIGAGLMLRSLLRLQQTDPGFRPEHVLMVRLSLPENRYPDLLEGVESLPGVASAGLISRLPPFDWGSNGNFTIAGRPAPPPADEPFAEFRFVAPGYFQTMGIPLQQGRHLTPDDRPGAPLAVVINEALARRHWPGESPLGAGLHLGTDVFTVVGVVGDVRNRGLSAPPFPELYISYLQNPWPDWRQNQMYLVVRTSLEPASLATALRAEVGKIDPSQPLASLRTLDQALADSFVQPRFRTVFIGTFAAAAVLLSVIGLYGVISYAVSQRTHEIGLRMALGAGRRNILLMVISQGVLVALAGVAAGLAAAFALTRLLRTFLYEITPTDPLTYAAVSILVIGVAVTASYVPARRAARIDPMEALRYE